MQSVTDIAGDTAAEIVSRLTGTTVTKDDAVRAIGSK